MNTVNINFSIENMLLGRVLDECLDQNKSLEVFISDALKAALNDDKKPLEGKDNLLERIIETAIEKAKAKPKATTDDDVFHLDDLCSPKDWEALSSGERKSMGKLFRNRIETMGIAKHAGRTNTNKAIYKRI